MTLIVEEDESANPADIGLLGAKAVMTDSDCVFDPIQQAWLLHETPLD